MMYGNKKEPSKRTEQNVSPCALRLENASDGETKCGRRRMPECGYAINEDVDFRRNGCYILGLYRLTRVCRAKCVTRMKECFVKGNRSYNFTKIAVQFYGVECKCVGLCYAPVFAVNGQ